MQMSTVAHSDSGRIRGHGLVLPEDDVEPTRSLALAYTHYLADCCRRFLVAGVEMPPALRPAHDRCARLVRQALGHNRGQVLRCFASAAVSAPLHCMPLRQSLHAFGARIDSAVEMMLPHLLLELALRGLIPAGQAVTWEHGAPQLASVSIGGELVAPEDATGLRFSTDCVAAMGNGIELARLPLARTEMQRALADDASGFRRGRRYRRLGSASHFVTIDHNPIAEFEAHPDKAGNHVDLGGRSEEEWVAVLDESFALIERFLPGELAEMRMMLREVIPVGYDEVRHLSASYREVIGTVYLTLHPNVMTMTEAVIHEFQHNKFNVSSYGATYLSNAFHPLYRSPIRPDPRPLWGILLAVHAFLPVAELYRRMRDGGHPLAALPEFERRMSEIDLKNHEGMEMLRAHADFTPAGRLMMEELEALERRHLTERVACGLETTPTDVHLA